MGIRRLQEEGMTFKTFKKYIYEIKRARGESMTSWINRSDEALMDMRKNWQQHVVQISQNQR